MNRRSLVAAFALVLSIGSAASADNPFVGVTFTDAFKTLNSHTFEYYVYNIDPNADGIRFQVTDSNGPLPGDTTNQTTTAFVTQTNAQIGINGALFLATGLPAG